MEGRVPEEIMEKVGSRVDELDVQLVDKREEDYVAPAYVAFSGKVGRVVNISFKLMQIAFYGVFSSDLGILQDTVSTLIVVFDSLHTRILYLLGTGSTLGTTVAEGAAVFTAAELAGVNTTVDETQPVVTIQVI